MAQQEDGWPLGLLQPMNARVIGLTRNHDRNGSISFGTLITGSPPTSSTDSTSDLDSQSTGSFFRDRSITLGSLMGVSSILELSRRSMRGRPSENPRGKKNCKSKPWLFSLCSKLNTDAVSMSNNGAPSLGHFLESERRAATTYRRNPGPLAYGPDDFSQDPNSLFVSSHIAPAQSSSWLDSNGERRSSRDLFENGNGLFFHLKVEHDVRDELLSIRYPSIPLQTLTYASILNSTMVRIVDLEEPVKGITTKDQVDGSPIGIATSCISSLK